jgi:hypothetical protein
VFAFLTYVRARRHAGHHELIADQTRTAARNLARLALLDTIQAPAAAFVDAHDVFTARDFGMTWLLRRNALDLQAAATALADARVIATARYAFLAQFMLGNADKHAPPTASSGARESLAAGQRRRAAGMLLLEARHGVFAEAARTARPLTTRQLGARVAQRRAGQSAGAIRANEWQTTFVARLTGFPEA